MLTPPFAFRKKASISDSVALATPLRNTVDKVRIAPLCCCWPSFGTELINKSIVDHKSYGHSMERVYVYIKNCSNKQMRKTPKDWHLYIEWKYGTTGWEHLTDLRVSNPIEDDEYAASNNLYDTPAFVLWVPHVLKKRIHIVSVKLLPLPLPLRQPHP
jgi:hypothetical protein